MTRAGTTEQRAVMRARTILRAAEGAAHVEIGEELGVSVQTVLLWRSQFKEQGLAGLANAPRPGRPRTYGREAREQILASTLTRPEATTHWSRARLAMQVGVSPSTVGRVWAEGRLKPHRAKTSQYSRDPQLTAKITDVVGLYRAPPERASRSTRRPRSRRSTGPSRCRRCGRGRWSGTPTTTRATAP